MQEEHLYEYAVIRIVPKVEREEFMNAGVILFCKKQKYLRTRIVVNEPRLLAFAPHLNLEEITTYLSALQRIAHAESESGPIGLLDVASRFRWLTAVRSTVIQTSKVHPGLCIDLNKALEKLAADYVG